MSDLTSPRRFSSPPTAQELERLAEDVANLFDVIRNVVSLKPRIGVARSTVTLGYKEVVRIDTDSGNTVKAMLPDVQRGGIAGLLRLSGAGAIDVYPAPGKFVDNLSVYSVSADVGCWLFYSDSISWFSVR